MPASHTLSDDRPIPYDLFQAPRGQLEAQRARKLESIYHKGQDRIWDGQEMLKTLMEKHGGIHVKPEHRESLRYVLSLLMWGEYAAWRVSSQLADRLDMKEARMAACSQSHDEARHFYVLHDYIQAMGVEPVEPRPWGRRLIEMTLRTEDVNCKLLGMQLLIEMSALAMFKGLREARVDGVLSDILPYYERDEARHVGLGTQLLPETMEGASPLYEARFNQFAFRLFFCIINELREMEDELRTLGINPRNVIQTAKDRNFQIFRDMRDAGREERRVDVLNCFVDTTIEAIFPLFARGQTPVERARGLGRAAWNGIKPADRRVEYNLRYTADEIL